MHLRKRCFCGKAVGVIYSESVCVCFCVWVALVIQHGYGKQNVCSDFVYNSCLKSYSF
jgi:hypothetical protein